MGKNYYHVRRAAVIGSGTMGGGIAALLAGVGIRVTLLDIAPSKLREEEDISGLTLESPQVRNRIVQAGVERMKKSQPPTFYSSEDVMLISQGNLEDDFSELKKVDWVVEAIVEDLEIKRRFYKRLDSIRPIGQIVSSNTSGLLIHDLSSNLSADFRRHFLGTHFFNPPRYMRLLEIIPTRETDPDLVEFLSQFASLRLGKGVVLCKDTPNFIANRIGGASSSFRMSFGLENGYSIEEVDRIAGPLMGYPKTAVFRLLDLVGVDVASMVSSNIADALPGDAAGSGLQGRVGEIMNTLVERGWLGTKSEIGFYKQVDHPDGSREFWPLDTDLMEHVPPGKVRFDSIGEVRNIKDLGERLRAWVQLNDRAAQYVWHTLAFLLSYSSMRVPDISDDILSIDRAMRLGFMMEAGPFEYWDLLGVSDTVSRMDAGGYEVAQWVRDMLGNGHTCFYRITADGKEQYNPLRAEYEKIEVSHKSVSVRALRASGKELNSNSEASLFDIDDGVLLLEFHGKANTIGAGVIEMVQAALDIMERNSEYLGMVIGNQGSLFSAGANIDPQSLIGGGESPAKVVDRLARGFQTTMMGLRYCDKPIVVAPFGRTLGGATEFVLAGTRIVAHIDVYMGLVEVGVGLVPAGGGCKELLRRVVNPVMAIMDGDPLPPIKSVFETVGMAKVSMGAVEARHLGFILPADRIVMNLDELLGEAKREVLHLSGSGYVPPRREKIYAAGRDTLAALRAALFQMHEGKYISDHDRLIGDKLAWILTGGDLSNPTWVDEQYILDLEREAFVDLIQMPKTIERIVYTLKTGKPLRN